ncbi:hypothetical protein [Streptomyces sp. NPDC001348]
MRVGRLLRGATVSSAVAGLMVLSLTSSTAHADAINNSCGGTDGNGYNPNSSSVTNVTVYEQEVGVGNDSDAVLQVKGGVLNGVDIVWAKLYNASVGDAVSLRWSDDLGANYHRCGRPASAGYAFITSGSDQYTLANNSLRGERGFKACAYDASADIYDCTPNGSMWIYP